MSIEFRIGAFIVAFVAMIYGMYAISSEDWTPATCRTYCAGGGLQVRYVTSRHCMCGDPCWEERRHRR